MEFISSEILNYCEAHTNPESELLQQLNRDTYAKILNPRMLSGHLQGRFLAMMSQMLRPTNILEIGTYTGYSALCLCEGLDADGKLITIDINDELESFSSHFFNKSKYEKNIEARVGDALQIIPTLDLEFDLVFIDADKPSYSKYFDLVIDKMKSGGIIIADNVLWSGHILKPESEQDFDTKCLHQFNEKVKNDPRVTVTMLPVRDGVSLIRKNGC